MQLCFLSVHLWENMIVSGCELSETVSWEWDKNCNKNVLASFIAIHKCLN